MQGALSWTQPVDQPPISSSHPHAIAFCNLAAVVIRMLV
jgi:hypothetical protein